MTTGIKAWLIVTEMFGGEGTSECIVQGLMEGEKGIEGVFLTTAELDTLVAEGEARGVESARLPAGDYTLFGADELRRHTQRQRDEGRAQGIEEALKAVKSKRESWSKDWHDAVEGKDCDSTNYADILKVAEDAILALRRQT